MFARSSSLPPIDEMFFEFPRDLRKLPIGYRQILYTGKIEAGLRISMACALEAYRWLKTRE
jgi:hypothetical protein